MLSINQMDWWRFRLSVFALAGVVVLALALTTALIKWPFTEARVIKTLEARSGRKVTIGSFQTRYFPPGMTAGDIQFLRLNHPNRSPLITVKQLVVNADWGMLLTFGKRVPRADVYGMRLLIPALGESPDGEHHSLIAPTNKKSSNLKFGRIVLHDVLMDFLPDKEGVQPFRVAAREIVLSRVGNDQPFGFDAIVENPLPKGEIREKGSIGPWDAENPSKTPIKGTFTFRNGQMRDIPGISGTMQSDGSFQGELGKVELQGTALIPNFHVLRSSYTESLRSTYQATVDATNGNVELKFVDVAFGRTKIHSTGRVIGRVATLEAKVEAGRIEDLERLVMAAKVVPLVGAISLNTSIHLPPGPQPFLSRLEMAGQFRSTGDRFSNLKTQEAINRLAERKVESQLAGAVTVKGGVARLNHLLLTAPQTEALMDGTLNLLSQDVNVKGTLRTDGKLSDTQSGFKAFAVKIITPFLKKHGATQIAFKIDGKYGHLKPHMNLGGKRKL